MPEGLEDLEELTCEREGCESKLFQVWYDGGDEIGHRNLLLVCKACGETIHLIPKITKVEE